MVGGKARLPEPPRKLTAPEAAIVRGHADSIALKLACHDPAVHRKLVPGGQQARAVFDAVEQARVEAIGARRMAGVAKNLSAMLDDRFHRGKFDEVSDRADAPIEEALAMMVRERLTGMAPPAAAKRLVDLWRPLIEDRAGRDLDRLEKLIENQAPVRRRRARSARRARHGRGPQLRLRRRGGRRGRPGPAEGRVRRGRRGRASPTTPQRKRRRGRGLRRGNVRQRRRSRRGALRRNVRRRRDGRFRGAGRAAAPAPARRATSRAGRTTSRSSPSSTRSSQADELCEPEELDRLRGYLDKQLSHLQGVVARLANRLQRRLMAQQNRAWEFDLEEGLLDPARLSRVDHRSDASAVLQAARRTRNSATPW